jgi:hypothetical protein
MAVVWSTGLFACADLGAYLGASLCPCVLLHDVYTTLMYQAQPPPSAMDPLAPFYAACLSGCIAPPAAVCLDQWCTRGLDTFADRQRTMPLPPHDPPLPPASYYPYPPPPQQPHHGAAATGGGLLDYILYTGHFGETDHRRPPPPPPASWEHDGIGWDLRDNSEDFWPLSWCTHYTSELLSSAYYCRALGGQAPRLPLCYSLLIALIYPLTICPLTFMLRRLVVDQWGIYEPYPYTCLLAACCTPCALVQTRHEVHHHPPSSQYYHQGTTTTAAHASFPLVLNSIENFHC